MRDPTYRLYCLDGDGSITAAEWITANSDEDALMLARSLKKTVKCELWSGARLIAQVPAYSARAA